MLQKSSQLVCLKSGCKILTILRNSLLRYKLSNIYLKKKQSENLCTDIKFI